MIKEAVEAIVVLDDNSWHEARIPPETIASIYRVAHQGGGDWEGEVLVKDDCIAAKNLRVHCQDILVEITGGTYNKDGHKDYDNS